MFKAKPLLARDRAGENRSLSPLQRPSLLRIRAQGVRPIPSVAVTEPGSARSYWRTDTCPAGYAYWTRAEAPPAHALSYALDSDTLHCGATGIFRIRRQPPRSMRKRWSRIGVLLSESVRLSRRRCSGEYAERRATLASSRRSPRKSPPVRFRLSQSPSPVTALSTKLRIAACCLSFWTRPKNCSRARDGRTPAPARPAV